MKLNGPSYVEAVASDQPGKKIVHLLSFIPQKRTPTLEMVEDAVAARNLQLDLKTDRKPKRILLQPGDEPLTIEPIAGGVRILVNRIEGHRLVVVEF